MLPIALWLFLLRKVAGEVAALGAADRVFLGGYSQGRLAQEVVFFFIFAGVPDGCYSLRMPCNLGHIARSTKPKCFKYMAEPVLILKAFISTNEYNIC